MSKKILSLKEDENGFVFSGLALLLLLPALLISSTYLVAVEQGGETVSAQNIGDKVLYTSMRVENTIVRMNIHNMPIEEPSLKQRERNYEDHTGLIVSLSLYRRGGIIDRFSKPEENESFTKSYEYWRSELEIGIENRPDNSENVAINAELTGPKENDSAQDDNMRPSDNLKLEAENYKTWILVENEYVTVDIVRDDGKKKVEEDGNLIEIMVRDQLGVAKSERKLDLWDIDY